MAIDRDSLTNEPKVGVHSPAFEPSPTINITSRPPVPADFEMTINLATPPDSSPSSHAGATPPQTSFSLPCDFGEYELLEEIARGGMGVVYKARHRSLDRVVALKILLSGQFASQDELRRFYMEASAAAKLDHPGIVPVYEIGQFDSKHFLSMKYIEGASLSHRMAELRKDPRAYVAVLARVARAVHHAHQRGVLHRDLKPGNIIIDTTGNPLVTDLGLAKPVEEESHVTKTGSILGTPSYMAPEQASGQKEITTAVDIYALGAILYELLTGEPPHRGANALETVMMVINNQIVAPRDRDSSIDRGLDLICRKCLDKDPNRRYSSAAALADDLQNWLGGRRLSVVAPSLASTSLYWLRENARAAIASIFIGIVGGIMIGVVFASLGMDVTRMTQLYSLFPEDKPSVLQMYSWIEWVPQSVRPTMQFILMSVLALLGFANAMIVRPRSRDVAFLTGTLSGLFAALFSFAISIGWQPINGWAVQQTEPEMRLMSRALWVDSETTLQQARQSLLRRYPTLKEMSPEERGEYLADKLVFDQMLGVPSGLWLGLGVAMLIAVFPTIAGTLAAGHLFQVARSRKQAIIRYWEAAPLATTFFVMFVLSQFPQVMFSPHWLYQFSFYAALLLASYAAFVGWKWYYRLLLHATWLMALINYQLEVSRIVQAERYATYDAAKGYYEAAAERIESYLRQRPRDSIRFQAAIARLYAGDKTGYEKHCETMLEYYVDDLFNPTYADRLAKTCLLAPSNDFDLPAIHAMAAHASSFEGTDHTSWFLICRALSELRQGNGEQSLEWCGKAQDKIDHPWQRRTIDIISALALRQRGNETDAQAHFQAALENLEVEKAQLGDDPDWTNRLFFEILAREFEPKLGL